MAAQICFSSQTWQKSYFPYTQGANVTFQLGSGESMETFMVHKSIFDTMKHLTFHKGSAKHRGWNIKIPQYSPKVGFVFVHFLYTGKCEIPQSFVPANTSTPTEYLLRIALEVYSLARFMNAATLAVLAKNITSQKNSGLTASSVLQVIESCTPPPAHTDEWFRAYLKSVLKAAHKDMISFVRSRAASSGVANGQDGTVSIRHVLMTIMIELEEERIRPCENEKSTDAPPLKRIKLSPSRSWSGTLGCPE